MFKVLSTLNLFSMKKNLEIITYEYKGIKVTVKIDYDRGIISLVERAEQGYKPKKWVFADRGLEYLNSWKNILLAMEYAIQQSEQLLSEYENKNKVAREDLILEALQIKKELEEAKEKYKITP